MPTEDGDDEGVAPDAEGAGRGGDHGTPFDSQAH